MFDMSEKISVIVGGDMGIGKGIPLSEAVAGVFVLIADIVPQPEAQSA
jgi:hypothetical protein